MNPDDLIRIARQLATGAAGGGIGRPRQAELRRAVSTAYYALFHALANCCADMVVGSTPANRSQAAWNQTYRALEHGLARNQCSNRSMMSRFPAEIEGFGDKFVEMQQQRHFADYDPEAAFERSEVIDLIDHTASVIVDFNGVPARHKRAFAVYVLFRTR